MGGGFQKITFMGFQFLILFGAFGLNLQAAIPPLPPPSFGEPAFGVLVLEEGDAPQWAETTRQISTALTARFPVAFAYGLADTDDMQRGIKALEARRVKKIIVVPLFYSSSANVMKEVRYLLGIGKNPSQSLFKTGQDLAGPPQKRLDIHTPVVLMPTLDFSPVLKKILLNRALSLRIDRKKENLVLVSESPNPPQEAKDWKERLSLLAGQIQKRAGFKSAQAFLINEGNSQDETEKSEEAFKDDIRKLRLNGPVFILSTELADDLLTQRLHRILSDLLVGYNGKTLLPNSLIVPWVLKSAEKGAKMGDMRKYKEKGSSGFMNFPKIR